MISRGSPIWVILRIDKLFFTESWDYEILYHCRAIALFIHSEMVFVLDVWSHWSDGRGDRDSFLHWILAKWEIKVDE